MRNVVVFLLKNIKYRMSSATILRNIEKRLKRENNTENELMWHQTNMYPWFSIETILLLF